MTTNDRIQAIAQRAVQRLTVDTDAAASRLYEQYGVVVSAAGYASVPTEHADQLDTLAPLLVGRKVYVGISPDEWDE